mgnify:CR=1 FL=1
MRTMKDSGIEWIGEIPLDWGTSKMRYIGQYINGYAFKPDDWSSEGKRIIRIQDLITMLGSCQINIMLLPEIF